MTTDAVAGDPNRRKVLWVDDNYFDINGFAPAFYLNGYELVVVDNTDEVLPAVDRLYSQLALVILDVRLPPGQAVSSQLSRGGFETGLVLGAKIRGRFPAVPVLGLSVCTEEKVKHWFSVHASGYLVKSPYLTDLDVFRYAEAIIRRHFGTRRQPRMFIVHGHDSLAKLALKNFLQNTLHLGEPIVLHEQPNFGRTIIEKFEDETEHVDVVFVILTPDDLGTPALSTDEAKRRARQNVIFELGYFYGRLRRRSGSVVLCHAGDLDLPSDIAGIVYVDVSGGIDAAGDSIRKELTEWLD